MRAALSKTRANVCIYDLEGHIRLTNRAWYDKFLLTNPGEVPTHVQQVRTHWRKFLTRLQQICATGESQHEVAYLRQREHEKKALYYMHLAPVEEMPDHLGNIQFVVSMSIAIDRILEEGERTIIDLQGKVGSRHKKRDPKVP